MTITITVAQVCWSLLTMVLAACATWFITDTSVSRSVNDKTGLSRIADIVTPYLAAAGASSMIWPRSVGYFPAVFLGVFIAQLLFWYNGGFASYGVLVVLIGQEEEGFIKDVRQQVRRLVRVYGVYAPIAASEIYKSLPAANKLFLVLPSQHAKWVEGQTQESIAYREILGSNEIYSFALAGEGLHAGDAEKYGFHVFSGLYHNNFKKLALLALDNFRVLAPKANTAAAPATETIK